MTTPLKTQPHDESVESFIASWPDDLAPEGRTLCALIQKVTGHKPVRWGTKMIGFGTYHYAYASGRTGDWTPIAIAPRKNGLTLYLVDDQELYKDQLSSMTIKGGGKSCVYLKRLSEIDLEQLGRVIKTSYDSTMSTHSD